MLGILTLAFGSQRYLRLAETLTLSVRRNMPGVPVALITDQEQAASFVDQIIPIDRSLGLGVVQKLYIDRYSPFQETLFIDADCVVTRSFDSELQDFRAYDFTPMAGPWLLRKFNQDIIDESAAMALAGITAFKRFNGGVYYFKKNEITTRLFDDARVVLRMARELGITNFDRAGPNDETILGFACARAGLSLYEDDGRVMRTPVESIGRIQVDPLGGGTRFNKQGIMVEPAICHFAGPWQYSPEYRYCERLLRSRNRLEAYSAKARLPVDRLERRARLVLRSLREVAYSRGWIARPNRGTPTKIAA